MTTKEMIAVMQAYENGAEIEYRDKSYVDSKWEYTHNPTWNWGKCDYRIKQQPKQKLWYWEFKYKGEISEDWWELHDVRLTEEEAQEKSELDHKKLEALGFIEE